MYGSKTWQVYWKALNVKLEREDLISQKNVWAGKAINFHWQRVFRFSAFMTFHCHYLQQVREHFVGKCLCLLVCLRGKFYLRSEKVYIFFVKGNRVFLKQNDYGEGYLLLKLADAGDYYGWQRSRSNRVCILSTSDKYNWNDYYRVEFCSKAEIQY